jgi:hypothetical protein
MLDPDLEPKKLSSSILKHIESLALSLYGKYKAKHQDYLCANHRILDIRDG